MALRLAEKRAPWALAIRSSLACGSLRAPLALAIRSSLAYGSLRAPLALAVLALLVMPAPVAAEGETNAWYAERITSGDIPVHVEHLWSKGSKLRAEMVIGGHPILTLVSGERYTVIDRVTNTGVSIQRSPRAIREDANRSRPFGNEGNIIKAAGAEKVSTEKMAGRQCDLYRLTNAEGRQEVCISRGEEQLPLQVRIWRRKSGKEARTRFLDWKAGLTLRDDFFEPDSAVTLEYLTHDDYLRRATTEQIGPAPPFFRELLHGTK